MCKLKDDFSSLVHDIEHNIGCEINIKVDTSRKDILACDVDEQGATILIPKIDYFPDASVLHELLHIRRICLEKIPRLVVCENYDYWSPKLANGILELDNNLEHCIIIPEELKLRPERIDYWESFLDRKLDDFHSLNCIQDDKERIALMYLVLAQHIFSENKLAQKIDIIISSLDIVNRAKHFLDAITPYIYIKEKLVKICFEYLKLPYESGCLKYIDCKNKSYFVKKLEL